MFAMSVLFYLSITGKNVDQNFYQDCLEELPIRNIASCDVTWIIQFYPGKKKHSSREIWSL
jgi:hypothetical protein